MELLDDIEEGELDIQNIFIEPPYVNLNSDEDRGDEDGGGLVNNLSARQLQAPAQAVLSNGLVLGEEDEEEEEDGEENFQRNTKHRSISQKDSIPYNWTEDHICLRKSPEPSAPLPAHGASLSGLSEMRKFALFFGALYEHLRLEIIRYGSQFAPGFQLSIGQMKQVLGIHLLSGCQPVPKRHHYWMTPEDVHHPFVASPMPRNRFEEIWHFFQCANNDVLDSTDKMAKLRPVMDILNGKFDEAMVEYFGRHGCKQAIRSKLIRFGFKAWCLNSSDGYLMEFDIYQGAAKGKDNELLNKKYGKGEAILLRMLDSLPQSIKSLPMNFFIDNYFTSLPLVATLGERGYSCTGTLQDNRIPKYIYIYIYPEAIYRCSITYML